MSTRTLAVILARAGSKGLPEKNALPLAGRPMIAYTIEAALAAARVDAVCVTTDLPSAGAVALEMGVSVIDRPAHLASDTATVDAAARHAVDCWEDGGQHVESVALLYGNVPVRPPNIIDQAIARLVQTGADSVRSVRPVSKQHPDWLHRLDDDRMVPFRKNAIYRRQDLEPLYYHDGAVVAVTRSALFRVDPSDPHAFLGNDRRAVISRGGPTVDVDSGEDLALAETILAAANRPAASRTVATRNRVSL